jgi:hypothetical protein
MFTYSPTIESPSAMEPILERPSTTTYLSGPSPTEPLLTTVPTSVPTTIATVNSQFPTGQSSLATSYVYAT